MRRAIEGLAARARISLATGEEVPKAPAPVIGDPFGLTPRAGGSRARHHRPDEWQIADELFISESTAGVHVSNIPGKLGVATRTEAAGWRCA